MQAVQFLHTAFAQALPTIHARRLAALIGSAAAGRPGVPAVEVAASLLKLPFGVSLSVLAQV